MCSRRLSGTLGAGVDAADGAAAAALLDEAAAASADAEASSSLGDAGLGSATIVRLMAMSS